LSYADPSLAGPLAPVDLSQLRIGFTEDFGVCAVDPAIRRTLRQRVQALGSMVARCEPVALDVGDADRVFDILRAESFYAGYADTLAQAPQTLAPHVRANIEMAGAMTLADRAWAHLTQTRIARAFAKAFDDFDLIIAPTSPVTPFPWTTLYAETVDGQAMRNYYHWLALTYVSTLATNPALALPCGVDEAGMPFGLQVIGPLRGDARLLSMAAALEQGFAGDPALRRPRPDLSRLQEARPALRSIVTHPPGTDTGTTEGPTATAV
jgi:Asp-tRNA(Asn)/Glu-tRNA(Gln) amidotransferase A subunit family amidase